MRTMTCSRRWHGNWSNGTVLAKPPTLFGEPSVQNIKSCFQRTLIATMMPHPSKCRAFFWRLSLTPRVSSKAPWRPRLLSSLDSDRKPCPVRSGADGQLCRNRRHCSVSVEPKQAPTETHRPVPHHEIVQALIETLGFRHIGVVHDEYAVSPDGMKAFGVLDLATEMEGCRFSIGLRNSHDKSM